MADKIAEHMKLVTEYATACRCIPAVDTVKRAEDAWKAIEASARVLAQGDPTASAPAAEREPLTDEQIDAIHLANSDAYDRGEVQWESHGFARAIEAAHGIGTNPPTHIQPHDPVTIKGGPAE